MNGNQATGEDTGLPPEKARTVRKRDATRTTDNAATDRMPSLGQRWSKPAPRIDVKFPILGFLMESEMTGYGLRRTFAESVGFFYRASDGSLYPALKKLARDGMVTVRSERQGRRVRKVYAITPGGRKWFVSIPRTILHLKHGGIPANNFPANSACQIFGSVLVRILVTTVRKSNDPFGTQD